MPGAGGKFILNTLAYSKKVAVQDYIITNKFLINNDYQYLTSHLLDTIPPKGLGKGEWFQRELGCHQLWGNDILKVKSGIQPGLMWKDLNKLIENDTWLPVIAHGRNEFNNLKTYFKDEKIYTVYVQPSLDFLDCAIRKKWPGENHCLNLGSVDVIKQDLQEFNFEFIFQDWDPRQGINQINQLSANLDFKFDLSLAKEYTDKYCEFHLDCCNLETYL